MTEPDDLGPWADDDLVRALRAPGTATELADEQRYVAAFRDAHRSDVRSLPRRVASRLGTGGTAVVVTVALSSGVAAAYTGHLPDPVQSIAHSVLPAAPAPAHHQHHEASAPLGGSVTRSQGPGAPSSSASPGGPTTGASPTPSATPTAHHGRQGTDPSGGPSSSPSAGGSSAAATSMSAPTHRVGLGQTMTLTGLVTDATGAPLPAQVVTLQVRGPRHWRPVAQVTTDDLGVATASTPPVVRSERFRWHAGPHVNSLPWLVKMVPILTVSADVGGATTTVTPVVQGASPGDAVQLFRHAAGRTTLVRRARLGADGSVPITVATPRRHATYVVRLLPTRRHAAVRARVFVTAPRPATVSITGSASRVTTGAGAVIGGTVTSATGDVLPGHKVVLLERGPSRWRPVGHAVSDSAGHVSIPTPTIGATSRFRLRTDHRVHSVTWRIVELPVVTASAQRNGSTLAVSASASGARAGDKVVLLRRVGGRLVAMRHTRLDAAGSATFSVPARRTRTTYVVRVVATKRHGPARVSVVVPKA
jgi:hypothetical protein